jgi:hypothetical protein
MPVKWAAVTPRAVTMKGMKFMKAPASDKR